MRTKKAEFVKGRQLSDLLREPGCIVDERLSQEMPWPVYSLPGDRVLVMVGKRRGCLWMSRREVEQIKSDVTVEHLLTEYDFGAGFLDQIPQLLEQAQTVFGVPAISDVNTDRCMQCLDEAVRKFGSRKCLKKDIFPLILAYSGEILRKGISGEWRLQLSTLDRTTVEPWIYGGNEKQCPLAGALYKELYENGRRGSILAVVRMYLAD